MLFRVRSLCVGRVSTRLQRDFASIMSDATASPQVRSDVQTELLDAVANVEIDEGVFKYVLIQVRDGDAWKFIVRGYDSASYHGAPCMIAPRTSSCTRGLTVVRPLFAVYSGRV